MCKSTNEKNQTCQNKNCKKKCSQFTKLMATTLVASTATIAPSNAMGLLISPAENVSQHLQNSEFQAEPVLFGRPSSSTTPAPKAEKKSSSKSKADPEPIADPKSKVETKPANDPKPTPDPKPKTDTNASTSLPAVQLKIISEPAPVVVTNGRVSSSLFARLFGNSSNSSPARTVRGNISPKLGVQTLTSGSRVRIQAGQAPEGMRFAGWRGNNGLLNDPSKRTQTFNVPSKDFKLTAIYKSRKTSAAPTPTPDPAPQPNPTPSAEKQDSVILTSHNRRPVDDTGDSIKGIVANATANTMVVATINNQRTMNVSVDPETGRFLFPVYNNEVRGDSEVRLSLKPVIDGVEQEVLEETLPVSVNEDGITNLLGRVTFGATPALLSRVRKEGFENYVREQLNPDRVDNSALGSMKLQRLITERPNYQLRQGLMELNIGTATYSERQLLEVLTRFWDNHFYSKVQDQQDFIGDWEEVRGFRQNALGNFRDLLEVSAKSPVMGYYLNNRTNQRGAINENYARELLELHTVGVNGGYGADDIIAVAEILTGWGTKYVTDQNLPDNDMRRREFDFFFYSGRHDTNDKFVPFLNQTFQGRTGEAGLEEGEELLDVLATHPKTQAFVCGKLVQLFVADQPPANFVNACVEAWETSGGEMKQAVRAILLHPDFKAVASLQRNKAKTPFEFAASYARNFAIYPKKGDETHTRFWRELRETVETPGYSSLFPVPTGHSEEATSWVSSGVMVQQYRELTNLVRLNIDAPDDIDADYTALARMARVQTTEGIAHQLMSLSTNGRFRRDEFEALVAALEGSDGIFDPTSPSLETDMRRAIGLLITLPSFLVQ